MEELVMEYHYEDGDIGAYLLDELTDTEDLEAEVRRSFQKNPELERIVIRRLTAEEIHVELA